jgi:hypothetical protein
MCNCNRAWWLLRGCGRQSGQGELRCCALLTKLGSHGALPGAAGEQAGRPPAPPVIMLGVWLWLEMCCCPAHRVMAAAPCS